VRTKVIGQMSPVMSSATSAAVPGFVGSSSEFAAISTLARKRIVAEHPSEVYTARDAATEGAVAMQADGSESNLLELTAEIVSAHVSNNSVPLSDLPGLIQQVYATLSAVGKVPPPAEKPQPAVPIKKSIHPDYIICLEDGKKLKMLKRHLKTAYNMSPEQYRERWQLPPDYPMVAPNYAKHRSSLAKKIGLGTKPRAVSGRR
jgi:predicted transcriptional regulator